MMCEYYTGIELGTDSIKIVVVEKKDGKYNCLAANSYFSSGVVNGQVYDVRACSNSIRDCCQNIEDMLDIKISKVIAAISPKDCKMDIVVGTVDVADPTSITGADISSVLNQAVKDHRVDGYEIITVTPINFIVDDNENIKDPKGMAGSTLEAKVVISSIPKNNLYKPLEAIRLAGLETIDVAFTSTGDYHSALGVGEDVYVGAVLNIGESTTNVSIFNKGIQIKHSQLPVGSVNVDKDLSYIYNIDNNEARKIKEEFAYALEDYADEREIISVTAKDESKKDISQIGASKVVEARLREILKLSKNEIKNLTNREIRYIIVTGGLSEIQGFNYLLDNEFNGLAKLCKISTIGLRHNKYSSAFGVIKYFDLKLALRGKSYNMIDNESLGILTSTEYKLSDYNGFQEVYNHLFD